MKLFWVKIGLSAFFLATNSYSALPQGCPLVELGETQMDCPWANVARQVTSGMTEIQVADLLQSELPGMISSVKIDSGKSGLVKAWGESINYDELAKGEIVQNSILRVLTQHFGVPAPREFLPARNKVHAGLEHTYGYLLSTLQTSFGYKRARWVADDIEFGLGLPRGELGPKPSQGTLLGNLTHALGRISLSQPVLGLSVSPDIEAYSWENLIRTRLVETVKNREFGFDFQLITDLVQFPIQNSAHRNTHLLIYSVVQGGSQKLITAFPVDSAFVARVKDAQGLGDQKPISPRYNAYVAGMTEYGKPLLGERKLILSGQN